jgi:hypothetical protein
MSTAKTPYELRMEMVQLANDYFNRIQEVNTSVAMRAFDQAIELGKASYQDWEKFAPKQYTFDEVLKKAEELYKFVSTK